MSDDKQTYEQLEIEIAKIREDLAIQVNMTIGCSERVDKLKARVRELEEKVEWLDNENKKLKKA